MQCLVTSLLLIPLTLQICRWEFGSTFEEEAFPSETW